MNSSHLRPILLGALLVAAACDPSDSIGIGGDFDPRGLDASYTWVLERWNQGDPQGHPLVELSWELPPRYQGEAFRVYSRGGLAGDYILIATVTSCSAGICRYGDTNIAHGESYDYYVASVDERDGRELGTSEAIRVDVPNASSGSIPSAPTAVSMDGAVFLSWVPSGAQRYIVVSELENGDVFLIGETDGTSFVDDRAENGSRHRYYLASVDTNDHVSGLSSFVDAFPRPDYYAEIVYSGAAAPALSGFRFVSDPVNQNPVVNGSDASRHWRLIETGGTLRIEPAPGNGIYSGGFTTQLTCGAGSEADCEDIRTAPADSEFSGDSVAVEAGFTYVLRLVEGSQVRFAKLRVQGESQGTEGRLIVFDWAYQTRVNERTLNQVPE